MEDSFRKLYSVDPEKIVEGIKEIKSKCPTLSEEEIPAVVDALSSLFYVDPFDNPEMTKVIDDVQQLIADIGPRAIPTILEKIHNTDIKAELAFARTCGLMGKEAIEPLLDVVIEKSDTIDMSFALYAFGKIKSPEIVKALPHVLKAVKSPMKESEDTAVRAMGKIFENIKPGDVSDEDLQEVFDVFLAKTYHSNEVIRSKSIRGLNKMLQFGFIRKGDKPAILNRAKAALGLEDSEDWDPSYLVRREAQQVLDKHQ